MPGAWDVDPEAPWQRRCFGCSKASPWAMGASQLAGSPSSGACPTWCGPPRRILLPQFEPLALSVPPQLSSSPLSAGGSQLSGGAFPPGDPCHFPLLSGTEREETPSGSPQLPDFSPKPLWWAERKSWFKEVRSLKRTQEEHQIWKAALNGN